ncbi:hypothetical protein [Parasphingorhabdus sp.]|uniref:hypothetical protein n=1 Tax=Parasphingorhabdus sp. TaxID=2709688 RepID=UPI00326707DD
MQKDTAHNELIDLVVKLENVLGQLDAQNAKLAAIKVDEAIASLCESHNIPRSQRNKVDF